MRASLFPLPSRLLATAVICTALPVTAQPEQAQTTAKAEHPNVLLICVDDLKPVLGCYGDPAAVTPSLDRFAASALLFERAYCNQAVCAPSRNALLTGLRPTTSGIYDLGTNFRRVSPDTVTLPQRFKNAGYHTVAAGKIFHIGHGNVDDPSSWTEPLPGPFKTIYYQSDANPKPDHNPLTREAALFSGQSAAGLPRGAPYESPDVPDDFYPDGKIAQEIIRRLRESKNRPNTPFFLAMGVLKPHLPFCAPKKYWDRIDPATLPIVPPSHVMPEGAPAYAGTNSGELRNYSDIPESGSLDQIDRGKLIHGYYAAVSYADAQIGLVLQALEDLGLAENTIVVIWGDHGWHLGDHGLWCKHTNYEQAARIPVLIRAPGLTQPGSRTRSLLESVDIYPTLCELAGLEPPAGLDGTSQTPALVDPAANVKSHILHTFPRGVKIGRALRTATHRLVEWKEPGADPATADLELYDYRTDPYEFKNHASEAPEKVQEMRALLNAMPEAAKPWKPSPEEERGPLFDQKDRDGNGMLTMEEFLEGQSDPKEAPNRFRRFDANQDGSLTRQEFIFRGK